MLRIGIAGCGLQAATIASYLDVYGDDYEVAAVVDTDFEFAKARIAEKSVKLAKDCRFYRELDEYIEKEKGKIDGTIIGTPCALHTDFACKLEKLGKPIYLEKPVAVTLEQARRLYKTFKSSKTPVQVSLPMRVCPLAQKAKSIIDSGALGSVEQIVGYNDVAYGEVYYATWFRDFAKTGGMFMQKAVHDIDYMLHLAGGRPAEVCAMRAQRVFKGEKPFDLSCDQCDDQKSCHESPYNRFHERGHGKSVADALKYRYGRRMCHFSKDIKIDDMDECVIELESGAHLVYSQNFFVRNGAGRRGARFHGYKGTLQIDYGAGKLAFFDHFRNGSEEISVSTGNLSHYGGDQELVHDFLKTLKTGERASTDLISGDGVASTFACLTARESADLRKFLKVEIEN